MGGFLVTVLPNVKIKANTDLLPRVPIHEALELNHPHLAQVPGPPATRAPRVLQKDAVRLGYTLNLLFLDLDRDKVNGEKDPWPLGYSEETTPPQASEAAWGALQELQIALEDHTKSRPLLYATRHGMRVVWRLKTPVLASEWAEYYKAFCEWIEPAIKGARSFLNTCHIDLAGARSVQPMYLPLPGAAKGMWGWGGDHLEFAPTAPTAPTAALAHPPVPPGPLDPSDPLLLRLRCTGALWLSTLQNPLGLPIKGVQIPIPLRDTSGRIVDSLQRSLGRNESMVKLASSLGARGASPLEIWRLLAPLVQATGDEQTASLDRLWWLASERGNEKVQVFQGISVVALAAQLVEGLRRNAYLLGDTLAFVEGTQLRVVDSTERAMLALGHSVEVYDYPKDDKPPKPLRITPYDARLALAADLSTLRPIEGVVETPLVSDDGQLQWESGYDPRSRLWRSVDDQWPEPPTVPGQAEAAHLARHVLDLLTSEVPWAGPADEASFLAAAITCAARPFLAYSTPAIVVNGNRRNVGKSNIGQTLAIIAEGRRMPPFAVNTGPVEWQKELVALACTTTRTMLVDNQTNRFGNAYLAALITANRCGGRILGASRRIDVPFRANLIVTMNDATVDRDFESRIMGIRLSHPDPASRTFDTERPDVLAERDHRPIRIALLALLGAYRRAEVKGLARAPVARFGAWDSDVGGCVWWALGVDPHEATLALLRDAETREGSPLEDLLVVMRQVGLVRAGQVIERAQPPLPGYADVAGILDDLREQESRNAPWNARSLGRYLTRASKNGDTPKGWTLEKDGAAWKIEGPDEAEPSARSNWAI